MGVLADIQAISTDSAQLAADQATLSALQAQVDAAQAAIAADTSAATQADATLSADLQVSGPVFTANLDGSVSVYQFATTPPGYTITKAIPAS